MPRTKPATGGDALIAYRDLHELTQEQLAGRLSTKSHQVSRSLLSLWETGDRDIQVDDAIHIEALIGIPREQLRPDIFERKTAAC